MFCQSCGAQNDQSGAFCGRCGRSLVAMNAPSYSSAPVAPMASGWNGFVMTFAIILALLIPIIGLVAGVIGLTRAETRGQGGIIMAVAALGFVLNFLILASMYL